MVLDGHSAASIAERLGIPDYHQLYRGKETRLRHAGHLGDALEARVIRAVGMRFGGDELLRQTVADLVAGVRTPAGVA